MYRVVFYLPILLFCTHSIKAQKLCAQMKVEYMVDTTMDTYPADKYWNGIHKKNNTLQLSIREGMVGKYKIVFNDSVYFSGNLSANPTTGYCLPINLLKTQKQNILKVESLDNGNYVSIKVEDIFLYMTLQLSDCKMIVHLVNKMPFKG
jgi:hypothetical protein